MIVLYHWFLIFDYLCAIRDRRVTGKLGSIRRVFRPQSHFGHCYHGNIDIGTHHEADQKATE